MVNKICPPELQLNNVNTSDTEVPFCGFDCFNCFVSCNFYDKGDDFGFDIVNFTYLDGEVPCRTSNRVNISQPFRLAGWCSHVDDLNVPNKCLNVKLLKQGIRYHKPKKAFSKFYR